MALLDGKGRDRFGALPEAVENCQFKFFMFQFTVLSV